MRSSQFTYIIFILVNFRGFRIQRDEFLTLFGGSNNPGFIDIIPRLRKCVPIEFSFLNSVQTWNSDYFPRVRRWVDCFKVAISDVKRSFALFSRDTCDSDLHRLRRRLRWRGLDGDFWTLCNRRLANSASGSRHDERLEDLLMRNKNVVEKVMMTRTEEKGEWEELIWWADRAQTTAMKQGSLQVKWHDYNKVVFL